MEVLLEEQDTAGEWVGYTREYLRVEVHCPEGAQGQYRQVEICEVTDEGLRGHLA